MMGWQWHQLGHMQILYTTLHYILTVLWIMCFPIMGHMMPVCGTNKVEAESEWGQEGRG